MGLRALFGKVKGALSGASAQTTEQATKEVVITRETLAELYPNDEPVVQASEWNDDGKELLVFAGLDDMRSPVEGVSGNECWFGAYVNLAEEDEEADLVWLPFVTEKQSIIDQLVKMQEGDRFIVTKSTPVGGLGSNVSEIELVKTAPRLKVPAREPFFAP